MKKIMNITTNGEDLLRFQSREDLKCYLKGFDLHGLEVLEAGEDERRVIDSGDVLGVHLRYYSAWMDLWTGNRGRLLDEFGTMEICRDLFGGDTDQALVDAYVRNVAFANKLSPEYMVFHVSECTMEESMRRVYHYTDEEVADAAAELINRFASHISGQPWLLLENLWYSGMTMERPEIVCRLLEKVKYPKVGVMLDVGHLLHTNMELKTIDQGVDYIHSILDRYDDLSFIKGVHLHQSLSGDHAKECIASWQKTPGSYQEQMWDILTHIFQIDTHRPFRSSRIREILERLPGLEYLVLEQISADREEHARQLQEQMAVLSRANVDL